jgi:hypothetical protein
MFVQRSHEHVQDVLVDNIFADTILVEESRSNFDPASTYMPSQSPVTAAKPSRSRCSAIERLFAYLLTFTGMISLAHGARLPLAFHYVL